MKGENMSYRLIDSNAIAVKYPEVNNMPCIFVDLPNGLDGQHYDLRKDYRPTIPTFTESAEAYKAWTGEEMGGTSERQNVAYICDKRRCDKEGCSNCGRTTDIEHAKNFELINNTYYERR